MFEVKDLRAGYGEKQILSGVSFSLESGTVTALLGANGCGKTTLLKAICGILPHKGSCLLDGCALEGLSAKKLAKLVSYIPQRSGISIDLTALDVVLMGFNPRLGLLQQPDAAMKEKASEALRNVGVGEDQNYLTLSEGQKQLCILARTMVTEGKLLLLDEPESALDLHNRYEIFSRIRRWLHDRAVLAALHDPQLALQSADRLILLKDGNVDAILRPGTDDLESMEQALGRIYGKVKLYSVDGTIVMVKKSRIAAI